MEVPSVRSGTPVDVPSGEARAGSGMPAAGRAHATTDEPARFGPITGKDRGVLVALVGAALVGGAALPLWNVGIGWAVSALAVLAVVIAARPAAADEAASEGGTERGASDGPGRAWRVAAGAAALVLAAVPALRASPTLAVICVGTAALLASYALTGGRTWPAIVAGAFAWVPAAVRGLGWSASGAANRAPRAGRVILGALVALALVLVFGGLLRGADPVFGDLIDSWLRGLSTVDLIRAALGSVVVAWAGVAAAYLARQRQGEPPEPRAQTRRYTLAAAEWVIPLVALDVLFAVFVLVQLTTLFGGNEYVLGAGGPDYADYARGGFSQLGIVTALTLGVVAALATWARRATALDLGLIRALGGILCGLTLVIVASALKRMSLYAAAYGFTWPRLLGFAGEVWLGLIFVLLLVAGVRLRADWLPRATVATAVAVLLALAAVNPEGVMARTALARLSGPYPVDSRFLLALSADAVGDIERLPPSPARDCMLAAHAYRLRDPDPWYGLNLARERARRDLVAVNGPCSAAYRG